MIVTDDVVSLPETSSLPTRKSRSVTEVTGSVTPDLPVNAHRTVSKLLPAVVNVAGLFDGARHLNQTVQDPFVELAVVVGVKDDTNDPDCSPASVPAPKLEPVTWVVPEASVVALARLSFAGGTGTLRV